MLAVDLDGTLLKTDTLVEGVLRALFHHPRHALSGLFILPAGRAAVKAHFAPLSARYLSSYPARDDLLRWLEEQRDDGRTLHLITAAHESVAEAAAKRFPIFDAVHASSSHTNLKGERKRALLSEAEKHWSYVGDSRADLPIFADANTAVLAGHKPGLERAVQRLGTPIEASFPSPVARFADWLKLLRVHQWTKNLLIFIPLILSGQVTDAAAALRTFLGFIAFCLLASGTYVLNDLSDLESDRLHPRKRTRHLASGRIPLIAASAVATFLIVIGLATGFALGAASGALFCVYAVLTMSYSLKLKVVPLLDTLVLATLFTLRLVCGAPLAAAPLSGWLIAFSMGFFLSLSLAKRTTEIVKAAKEGRTSIAGRGYLPEDAPLVLAFGTASAAAAILLMILFLAFQVVSGSHYRAPNFLLATPLLMLVFTLRIWLTAWRGDLHDDPVVFAVRDRQSLFLGVCVLVCAVGAVFGPTSW